MPTKTISIMDDAYDALARCKLPGESFSDTVRRITKKKTKLDDLFGAWKDTGIAEDIKQLIKEDRELSRKRDERMLKLFA